MAASGTRAPKRAPRRASGRKPAAGAAARAPRAARGRRSPRGAAQAQCPELGPLMRSLHDAGVVTGDMGPNKSGNDTYWGLQSLVYLAAHTFGHPGLKYRYVLHLYGPHSKELADDFYKFDSMRAFEPIRDDEWKGLGAFLELARRHRSLDWLSMAATLSYFNEKTLTGEITCSEIHKHSRGSCLVELSHVMVMDFSRKGVQRVYESIKDSLPDKAQVGKPAP